MVAMWGLASVLPRGTDALGLMKAAHESDVPVWAAVLVLACADGSTGIGGEMERRIAVIFAADVVNFSRLMEVDEARAHRALRIRHGIAADIIGKHGGRIFGSAGDSVMVEFASAVEAVQAAVEIQNRLAEPQLDLPEG